MPWTGLLLFESVGGELLGGTFLYGCLVPLTPPPVPWKPALTRVTATAQLGVEQVRFGLDDAIADAALAALREGTFDFSVFGIEALNQVRPVNLSGMRRLLQPEPAIARRLVADGRCFGVPPGFLTSPTIVETFRLDPAWHPPRRDPAALVREPSGYTGVEPGPAVLAAMAELSGLPFNKAYAERVSSFEVMRSSTDSPVRIILRALRGDELGVEITVVTDGPVLVHTVQRDRDEVLIDRMDVRLGGPAAPIRLTAAAASRETEVRVFDAATGEVVGHRRFLPILAASAAMTVKGGGAGFNDELARRAPPSRRKEIADATRRSTEVHEVTARSGSNDAGERRRLRCLVGGEQGRELEAEWFPKGIGGELDVVERLRGWAEDPRVTEVIVVDPFMSPSTLTRWVRRVRRTNVAITAIASLTTEDPDRFGERADAAADLRDALTKLEPEIACRLRVVNVVEDRGLDAAGQPRPGRQAFHDRYVGLLLDNGERRTFVLTNSLNNASGNWPFVLAELPPPVAGRVNAYVDGLLQGVDLAGGLRIAKVLDWTNHLSRRRETPPPSRFGLVPTRDVLRTLSWLRSASDWAGAGIVVRHPLGSMRSRLKSQLVLAIGAGLISRTATGTLEVNVQAIQAKLRRAARFRPVRTHDELAILLMGFGEITAWSGVKIGEVVGALAGTRADRLLRRALRIVADRVRLEQAGSGDMELESLDRMPLGRRLVMTTTATLNDPHVSRSPNYGLTGALWAGLGLDTKETLRFLYEDAPPLHRELGFQIIYRDLNEYGRNHTFPSVLTAPHLSLRMAGVLHMVLATTEGGRGNHPAEVARVLAQAGWEARDRAWGLSVAFDRAMLHLQLRRDGDTSPHDLSMLVAEVVAAESAVAASWPEAPDDELLDSLVDIFDGDGERLVRLADCISATGGDADGLYRRCLRLFDNTIGLPVFELTDATERDRKMEVNRADITLHRALPLWAAVAYIRLTGTLKVTRLAGRYGTLLDHLECQALDPLFRAFRHDAWCDRVVRLIHLYSFVYRILDEAIRLGLTNGVAWFAGDVGRRVEHLLRATDGHVDHLQCQLALLARDRGRAHQSGLASIQSGPLGLIQDYLDAVRDAMAHPPDFELFERFASIGERHLIGGEIPAVILLDDVLQRQASAGQSVRDVQTWWPGYVARARIAGLSPWANFVASRALPPNGAEADVTPLERRLGRRIRLP